MGVGEGTLQELERRFDSYESLYLFLAAANSERILINSIATITADNIKQIRGWVKTAFWALSEAPPIGVEDYELILGLAAINKEYGDLIPKKTSPHYKQMVKAMIEAVYTKDAIFKDEVHPEKEGIPIKALNMQGAKSAFEVSEATIIKYLQGKSKPGYERLNNAIAMMAWDYKRSRKKEVKTMVKEKVDKSDESRKAKGKDTGRIFTLKVNRVQESRAEGSTSRTYILEPTGPIKCSKMVLKFVGTPDKPVEDAIGHAIDLGDEMEVEIGKAKIQTKLEDAPESEKQATKE
jgi:hypothetical protein